MAIFTCNQCTTRSMKVFSRESYERGIVLVTCPQCQARHLLADRLGWFGEPGSVDDFLADHGQGAPAFSLSTGSLLGGVGTAGWGFTCTIKHWQSPVKAHCLCLVCVLDPTCWVDCGSCWQHGPGADCCTMWPLRCSPGSRTRCLVEPR